VRRIGVLMNIAADDADAPVRVAAFAQGLQELGWVIGRNRPAAGGQGQTSGRISCWSDIAHVTVLP
jgi:hypothetical protein